MTAPRVALAPDLAHYAAAAVQAGGGDLVGLDEAPDALVWTQPASWATLRDTVAWIPSLRWVQLPFAGIEPVVAAGALVPDLVWTRATGVYSEPLAEHALALTLAGLRSLPMRARDLLRSARRRHPARGEGRRARCRHIDTEALVEALPVGAIGGGALDVTDPEPPPDGHPLWRLPNRLITPTPRTPGTPPAVPDVIGLVGLSAPGWAGHGATRLAQCRPR